MGGGKKELREYTCCKKNSDKEYPLGARVMTEHQEGAFPKDMKWFHQRALFTLASIPA